MAGVNDDRAIDSGIDGVVARLFIAVIEMDGEDRLGKHLLGRADERLEHAFVGIFSSAFGKLDDERSLALHVAAEEPEDLLHVVHVVSADGEFPVGDFVELLRGDDHDRPLSLSRFNSQPGDRCEDELPLPAMLSRRFWRRATSR